jgi:hypothetical protein
VSQHLRVLKEAGLIRTESPNRLSVYELVPAPLRDVEAWARQVITVWENAMYQSFIVYDSSRLAYREPRWRRTSP